MMITRLTIFTVVFAFLSPRILADDPCRFTHERGVIDMTSVGRQDGSAAYPDKIPPTGSNYKYSYNPCKAFSEGGCQNVAVCQVSMDGLFTFVLGTQESISWSLPAGLGALPTAAYSSGDKRVTVTFECSPDESEEFQALGEDPINSYKFRLKHKCACWNKCTNSPPPPTTKSPGGGGGGGVTGGTVFIILLLVLAFVYFVGFATFYRVRRQQSGVELIAHRTFWIGLPGYAKDGVVYVYRRISNRGADPYQKV